MSAPQKKRPTASRALLLGLGLAALLALALAAAAFGLAEQALAAVVHLIAAVIRALLRMAGA